MTRNPFATIGLSLSSDRADALTGAVFALLLGCALVYLAGFSATSEAHNAAHDTRHSLSFPCH